MAESAANAMLVLSNTTITNNSTADGGGGVFAEQVTTTNSTVSDNHANDGSGGGIETSTGPVALTNSTVTTNTARDGGGGIAAGDDIDGIPEAAITLTDSTVDHNVASDGFFGDGGGVEGSQLTATNSTITDNTDSGDPGGGAAISESITLVYVTVANNTSGSGTGANLDGNDDGATTFTSFGSVVALPLGGGTNCHNLSTTSHGYNWDTDGTCGFDPAPGDHSDAGNPNLGALANNGGPTNTLLPLTGSGLIDAIPVSACQSDGAARNTRRTSEASPVPREQAVTSARSRSAKPQQPSLPCRHSPGDEGPDSERVASGPPRSRVRRRTRSPPSTSRSRRGDLDPAATDQRAPAPTAREPILGCPTPQPRVTPDAKRDPRTVT